MYIKRKMKSAFSMMELIIYIVVVGIVAGFGLPMLFSVQDDAKIASEKNLIGSMRISMQTLYARGFIKGADFYIQTLESNPARGRIRTKVLLTKTKYPAGLSAIEIKGGDEAITTTNVSIKSDNTLSLLLDFENRNSWATSPIGVSNASDSLDSRNQNIVQLYIEGPATLLQGGVQDKEEFDEYEIDRDGLWLYDGLKGTITYQKGSMLNSLNIEDNNTLPPSTVNSTYDILTEYDGNCVDSSSNNLGTYLSRSKCLLITDATWNAN